MVTANEIVAVIEGDRVKAFLAAAGDAAPNVAAAVAWALRTLGYSTAKINEASDEEVAAVPAAKLDALLDLAELRTLESIQTNLTQVTNQTGPVRDDWNDLAKRLLPIVEAKRKNVSAQHGHLLARPLSGDARRRAYIKAL